MKLTLEDTGAATPVAAADPTATMLRLLAYLHRGGTFSYWWTAPGDKSYWWPVDAPTPIPTGPLNVYFGIHPVSTIPTTNANGQPVARDKARSRKALIAAVNALFAEFDAKDFSSKEGALTHIDNLILPPSVIIDSGGGYHCYWLHDTLILRTEQDRARAERLQKGWVALVKGDKGAKDLARVLRVAGTRNMKPEYGPDFPTVTILRADFEIVYDLVDLEDFIGAHITLTPRRDYQTPPTPGDIDLPGKDFDARGNPCQWLVKAGWHEVYRQGDVTYLRRPDKNTGVSASWNWIPQRFYNFSSSAREFEPDRPYTPFHVYATLEHNGDYRAAKEALGRLGYGRQNGSSPPITVASLTAARESKSTTEEEGQPRSERFILHHAAEALQPLPPVDWVVSNLMAAEQVQAWVGKPGSKKTYSLLDLAVCVAGGLDWLKFSTVKSTVLIVDEESGDYYTKKRVGECMRGHGLGADLPLYYITLSGLNLLHGNTAEVDALHELIARIGARLVIVDALADIMIGGDENTVEDVQPVMHALRCIASAAHCVIPTIHHLNKAGDYRGSTAIAGAVDLLMTVSSEQDCPNIYFGCTKSRSIAPPKFAAKANFSFGFPGQPDRFNLTNLFDGVEDRLSAAQKYVLSYITNHGASSVKDIKDHADVVAPGTARNAIYDLAHMGRLYRVDNGGPGDAATFDLASDEPVTCNEPVTNLSHVTGPNL
jgi:hypothetical protein